VLTCNLHYSKPDPAALGRILAESRPEIVALQEWKDSAGFNIFATDGWHVHRASGHFLASRYPVRRAERLGAHSGSEKGSVMRYELATPAGVVTLFSLHFASPRKGLQQVAHEGWDGMDDLQAGSARRREQTEHLARVAGDVAGPVLLVGDFNTPPESAIFRRFWHRYTDAFAASGWGWGYTFISRRTVVRIDHVLVGPGGFCGRCWVAADIGSPHRPVLADVAWPAADRVDGP
jgi:hypothetical protein